jgi:hypothetical protein
MKIMMHGRRSLSLRAPTSSIGRWISRPILGTTAALGLGTGARRWCVNPPPSDLRFQTGRFLSHVT